MIDHIPDDVLLEIFDFYRQDIDSDRQWRWKCVWFSLAHVCKKWRAVVFASATRLDLGIPVGPRKPRHIKTFLSCSLPILINYRCGYRDITGSALWRMRAVLKHCDRVRRISFEGTDANFDKFFKATNCPFPLLESLSLRFKHCSHPKIPDTFLRGPDLSDLHLRRLKMKLVSLTSVSGFLLSVTALTHLTLLINTPFSPSSGTSLLTCLQGMPSLRCLDLTITYKSRPSPPTPKDVVPLSKLSSFHYVGRCVNLDFLMAGISAPSLRDVNIRFFNEIWPPTVHLPRFINEMEECYHAVHVSFKNGDFHLSLLTQSECINRCKPCFKLGPFLKCSSESIIQISGALSMKFTTVEELRFAFDVYDNVFEIFIAWRRFLQRFPRVKAIRTERANNYSIAHILHQDHGNPDELSFLPVLEEIDLGEKPIDESQYGSQLAAFEPFLSARKQAGRQVNVFFRP
ncbi:hypothetical protein DFH94DRAFT_820681 [Russula ochroleuca]|jgi:hypothetical protein|uniref:F-box domain-containing protein n=1 Tax=Russula ochroleuca TaxID=152965 RepID=A0A9P5N1Q9_9AGAM|nr:hypothetical protein DFH94DRAFT_820681 [Russula ochroleuca]